ncbi:MAG: trap-t family transporter, partial [Fretibacterium sp.]|nr:trap-t family transporter [Fretibacterium sp.]
HFNSAAMILGLVLGVICEGNFSRAYTIARGVLISMFSFGEHPVACVLMAVSAVLLLYPVAAQLFRDRRV